MDVLSSEDWQLVYQKLKQYHDDAYKIIEHAIDLEEAGQQEQALTQYQAGLEMLDKALNIKIECPSNPDLTWEKAYAMIHKIKKIRKEILCRIADSQKSREPNLIPSMPPSYEEAMSSSRSNSSVSNPSQILTYSQLGAALQNLRVEAAAQSAHILYSYPRVQIYFISHDGTVKATFQPDTLKIVELEDGSGERPKAYLQIGEWIYPLVPGVSPCLKTEYGAFILPDLHSAQEGDAVGIILPEEADTSVHELLSDILRGIVETVPTSGALKRSARQRRDLSFNISQGIVKGAQFISQGVVRGAEKAGHLMNYSTPKLIDHLQPQENPTPINPKVQTGLQVAKNVTGGAVAVTGFIASRIGAATMALGRYLAPHVQRQGTRLLSSTCNFTEKEASAKVGGVLQVAAGAVEGFATVYDGLEDAAKILGNSLASNTVKIVQHKYGQPAGAVTGDTLYTVGNVFVAGNNIRHLTPKGIVKTTAKQAGKAVVEDYRTTLQNPGDSRSKPGPSSEVD